MKRGMHFSHACLTASAIEFTMLQCNISNMSWEEYLGTKAMSTRIHPIHSGFETLRLAGLSPRSSAGYHNFGSATNEQLTAMAYARHGAVSRPTAIFTDFRER